MRRALKWAGIVLGGLLALLMIGLIAAYALTESRINRTYTLPDEPFTVSADPETVALGEKLYVTRGCGDCHGDNGAGLPVIDQAPVGVIYGSNLTTGQGGIPADYNEADFARAMHHGVGRDGSSFVLMPSHEFAHFSDDDVGAIYAYIRSLPPVDRVNPEVQVGPIFRVLMATGNVNNLLPAELIDHEAPRAQPPTPGATVAYGAYLGRGCIGCHGEGLSGGPMPGMPPETPIPTNITPDTESGIGTWSEADFFTAMRTGTRPDGSQLDPFMPWKNLALLSDDELRALWLYLQTVPPRAEGSR